jgi:hypothetical protein
MGSLRAGGAPVYPAGGFGDNHKTDYLRSGRRSCAAFGDFEVASGFFRHTDAVHNDDDAPEEILVRMSRPEV